MALRFDGVPITGALLCDLRGLHDWREEIMIVLKPLHLFLAASSGMFKRCCAGAVGFRFSDGIEVAHLNRAAPQSDLGRLVVKEIVRDVFHERDFIAPFLMAGIENTQAASKW
jgi:hypothetical protein